MTSHTPAPLLDILSGARIGSYALPNEPFGKSFQRYQWNVRLSEAMLPSLHYLEVGLRNRIDTLIRKYYGQDWMLNPPAVLQLSPQDVQKLSDTAAQFRKEQPVTRILTNDDMVSRMSFGFWTAFFHKRYDPLLWHKKNALAATFPNMPRTQRTRHAINQILYRIKKLRNRIAHHEPIWNNRVPIADIHADCRTLIGAISADTLAALDAIDRLPEVWGEKV